LEGRSKRRSAVLLSLALGAALSATVALAGTARQAEAASSEKIVFSSNRTTGPGVNNPTGDYEIFRMIPDGTGVRQLTSNKADDYGPTLSPDHAKVSYMSHGVQTSNPEGDWEVYVMNASDGSLKKNLTNNGTDVDDNSPVFSPGGKKIAYESFGIQPSNLEGDDEVYVMRALDGSAKKNLSDNGVEVAGAEPVYDFDSDFSPSGDRIAYTSDGKQTSNPEGDAEVYRMNALDGSAKKNLSDNVDVYDASPVFSPDGKIIAYRSQGAQTSNLEGDAEVYRMNAIDGAGQTNLSNSGAGVYDGVYPD
jgi:Tol biopolymer transport system component